MKTPNKKFGFSKKLIALSVLAAFGSAQADEEEIAQLITPESTVSVGLDAASGSNYDKAIFGQYNGMRNNTSYLMLDLDVNKRDDTSGLWTNLTGHNLGQDNKELSFSQNKQGNWKYAVEYNEMVRRDPRTLYSGIQNPLTTTPTVESLSLAGMGPQINLDIRRKSASLSAEKWLTTSLLFEASVKNEDRDGARLSGVGVVCSNVIGNTLPCSGTTGALLMLPEPISSSTKQFEAKLNYSGENYFLSGGYYGTFYNNKNTSLNPSINGNLYNPDGSVNNTGAAPGSTLAGYLVQPFALAPDNQAQQFFVSGNYAITPTTRATFKYAFTHATQNDDFANNGLTGAPYPVTGLGGVLDSTLVQLGVTARPAAKLTMLANLRYEDKFDKTPQVFYNGAYTNDVNSSKKTNSKVEGSYQLPDNVRATVGVDYAEVHRELPVRTSALYAVASVTTSPLSALREKTKELSYRAELRRSMSETINAAVSYIQSKREGSSWFNISPANTTGNASTGTYPMTLTDRQRDKVKVAADWTPLDNLSIQLMFEDGQDKYTSPTQKGLRDTGMSSYGIDASMSLSEKWKLTGYANQANQILHVDHSTGYLAELENSNSSIGLGLVGKQTSKLELGAELSYMDDTNRYQQSMATGAAIVGGGLPDVTYRVASLKLFGNYAVQKNANIRVELMHQSVRFDEWTWVYNQVPFTYSDNSTVSMQQNQSVNFLGASYVYKFR